MSSEDVAVKMDETLPENAQDLTIFVQALLDQMVMFLI
jgi:hypothetical protein